MRTDFSEVQVIETWPFSTSLTSRLLPRPEELDDSVGFTAEDIEEKIRKANEIGKVTQLIMNMVSSASGPADFLYLLRENALLRQEVEQIKQKLSELEGRIPEEKVIVLRGLSREEAKQEIRRLFLSGRTLYYSDVAEELRLDLELVVGICQEMQESGEIKIDESAL